MKDQNSNIYQFSLTIFLVQIQQPSQYAKSKKQVQP